MVVARKLSHPVEVNPTEAGLVQVLVPVYNEGENVRTLYSTLLKEGIEFDRLSFVYDFDEDSTLPVIFELQKEDSRIIAEKNTIDRGVINALKHGFSKSEPGPVLVLMGDNSDKLSIIPEMIRLWSQGAVVVSPSRYMPGGEQQGGGLIKSNLSRLAGKSLALVGFPTSDPTNNFKLYDGQWLASQRIDSTGGFEVALELSCKAFEQRQQIHHIPTSWFDRTEGESNFKLLEWIPQYLKWYLRAVRAVFTRKFTGV